MCYRVLNNNYNGGSKLPFHIHEHRRICHRHGTGVVSNLKVQLYVFFAITNSSYARVQIVLSLARIWPLGPMGWVLCMVRALKSLNMLGLDLGFSKLIGLKALKCQGERNELYA